MVGIIIDQQSSKDVELPAKSSKQFLFWKLLFTGLTPEMSALFTKIQSLGKSPKD